MNDPVGVKVNTVLDFCATSTSAGWREKMNEFVFFTRLRRQDEVALSFDSTVSSLWCYRIGRENGARPFHQEQEIALLVLSFHTE